jgi:hypothetical protein
MSAPVAAAWFASSTVSSTLVLAGYASTIAPDWWTRSFTSVTIPS